MIKKTLAALLIGITFSGCSTDDNSKGSDEAPMYFFDLKGFIADYAQQMQSAKPRVEKKVNKDNSESQTLTLDSVNWTKELALLTESDINKLAYKDKYQEASIGNCVVYTALDSSLNTRLLKVCYFDDEVEQIYVERGEKNLLYQSGQILNFYPSGKYSVEAKQKIKGLGKHLFKTSIEIVK